MNHIVGKYLALTDYLNRTPTAPPQADEAYDKDYVINNILSDYKFMSEYGCLSNQTDQSGKKANENEHKTNNKLRSRDAREQTAIDCRKSLALTHVKSTINSLKSSKIKMNARTFDNLEAIDSS